MRQQRLENGIRITALASHLLVDFFATQITTTLRNFVKVRKLLNLDAALKIKCSKNKCVFQKRWGTWNLSVRRILTAIAPWLLRFLDTHVVQFGPFYSTWHEILFTLYRFLKLLFFSLRFLKRVKITSSLWIGRMEHGSSSTPTEHA